MPSISELALDHQRRRIALEQRTANRVLAMWGQADRQFLDNSWDVLAPGIVQVVAAAQITAARQSAPYLNQVATAQGFAATPSLGIPEAYGGVMLDGREVGASMFGGVATTKRLIGGGMGFEQAFQAGAAFLAMVAKTSISDIGRQSDMGLSVGRGYTQYVRVLSPGACSRCAILAGKSDYKVAFKRHPSCRCTSAPIDIDGKVPSGLHDNPSDYFESLPKSEQNRIFTNGGAESIRSGAGVQSVVDSRRGADGISTSRGIGRSTIPNSGRRITPTRIGTKADGSPLMGYTTTEGTYRGSFRSDQNSFGVGSRRIDNNRYTSSKRTRLMPQTLVSLTDDTATRQLLLRDAGYLERPVTDYYSKGESSSAWIGEMNRLKAADRAAADVFYRSAGVQLGG